jgi:hypothetical protein
MSSTFASQEWADALRTNLADSADVRMRSMSWIFGPIALVVDADDALGVSASTIRIDLHEGSVRGIEVVPGSERLAVPFRIAGSTARWQSVFDGSLDLVDAVLDSRLRSTGDLPTLSRHRDLFAAIAAAGGSVETTWPEPATA